MRSKAATFDRTGQYRLDLGWKRTDAGKRAQQRYYLGQNEDAVSLAEKRLEQFWTAIEQYFGKERDGAECFWEDWSLAIAKQIADGLMVVKAEIPDKLKPHLAREGLVIVLGGRTFLKSILVRSLASSWLHLLKQKTSSPSVGNSTSI